MVAGHHTPGAESLGELEHMAIGRTRKRPSKLTRIAPHRDVVVRGRTTEQTVAHGSADEPPVGCDRYQRRDRIAHTGSPSR